MGTQGIPRICPLALALSSFTATQWSWLCNDGWPRHMSVAVPAVRTASPHATHISLALCAHVLARMQVLGHVSDKGPLQ
jgi:hypothetical protein